VRKLFTTWHTTTNTWRLIQLDTTWNQHTSKQKQQCFSAYS